MGGSSGGGGGGTQTSISEPPKWAREYLGFTSQGAVSPMGLAPQSLQAYQQLRAQPDPSGFMPIFTGLSPGEQSAFMRQSQAAGQQGQLAGAGASALQGMLDPMQTPYLQQAAQGAFSPRVGGYDASQINAGQSPGLQQLLSGAPNTSIYDPVSQAMSARTIQDFQHNVLPMIRQESQSAGQFGGPMHDRASGIAAGRLGEALAMQNAQLYSGAAEQALADRRMGAQLGAGFTSQNAAAQNQAMQFGQQQLAAQRMGEQDMFGGALSSALQGRAVGLGMLPQTMQAGLMPSQTQGNIAAQQRFAQEAMRQQSLDMALVNRSQPYADLAQHLGVMAPLLGFGGVNTVNGLPGQGGSSRVANAVGMGTLGGVTGGAIAGAQTGSVVPGWGTAIGAGVGALAGYFM